MKNNNKLEFWSNDNPDSRVEELKIKELTDFIARIQNDQYRSNIKEVIGLDKLSHRKFELQANLPEGSCEFLFMKEDSKIQNENKKGVDLQRKLSSGEINESQYKSEIKGIIGELKPYLDEHYPHSSELLKKYSLHNGDQTHEILITAFALALALVLVLANVVLVVNAYGFANANTIVTVNANVNGGGDTPT